MVKKTFQMLLLICLSINVHGQQNDSLSLNEFKKFLPYVLTNLGNETAMELDEKTIGKFYMPWKVEKLKVEEANDILLKLVDNQRFRIIKDHTGESKLEMYSDLGGFETLEEIHWSNGRLYNSFIQVSDVTIVDDTGGSIYVDDEKKSIKINESKKIHFTSGQIHTTFPIKEAYSNLSGSIKITLKEYENIQFQEFHKGSNNISFDLGSNKGLRLLKIDKNRAYFIIPATADNLEIEAVNAKDEKFTTSSKSKLPEKIYDFATNKGKTDEDISKFIEDLSFEDVYLKEQILIFETNGSIEKLYIYQRSEPKELGSFLLEVKL